MAQFEWVHDAPTGTFKSHAMSARLFEAAIAKSVFMDHVQPVDGFGKNMGEDVTLTRIKNLTEPTDSTLSETDRIPEDDFQITTTSVTIQEHGRAVPFTSFAQDLTHFDMDNQIQRTLRDQMQLSLDTHAAKAFKNAQVKYIPTGATSRTIETNGTANTQATNNMNVWHLEEIRDYMFDTLHVPPRENDDYVGIFRTLGLRGIKRDPDFEEWHKYTDPSVKFNSEIGRMEGIRLIETNHSNALGKVGSSSVLGEGIVFGSEGVAMAESETPELRAAMPSDFGRSKAVAWYGQLGWGIIWDTSNAGEARVLHVTSS